MTALAACGGGGGSAPPPPTARVIAASWIGAGAQPAAGDILVLTFDQAVTLAAAVLFDDADVLLAAGDSLGSVTAVPTMRTTQSIEVTLGAGVTLSESSSVVDLSADQDSVFGLGMLAATTSSDPVAIQRADAQAPTISSLTIESIQPVLNGQGPADGTLQVAQNGFSFSVSMSDDNAFIGPIAWSLSLDHPVSTATGVLPAGANLAPLLVEQGGVFANIALGVGSDLRLAPGTATATVTIIDGSGLPSPPESFPFRVVTADDALRPFERGQTWFLDLSRDIESIEAVSLQGGVLSTLVTEGANGRSDFDDVREVLGLWTDMGIADVGDGRSSNEVVGALYEAAVLDRLATLTDGTGIQFTFDRPGTFPSGRATVPYASFPFSQICIAGAAAPTPTGTLGAALLDGRNESQEDDCQTDFQGLRLGVFLETAARIGLQSGGTSAFQARFAPFAPILGGDPIGSDPLDGERLLGTRTETRADQIDAAIDALAALTALVTAHECGHSMGLVANGAMPRGLYGGDAANFPLSGSQPPENANNHIENQSLFPGLATNVMSPALSLDAALDPGTAFNNLNLAYLREHVLYDDR